MTGYEFWVEKRATQVICAEWQRVGAATPDEQSARLLLRDSVRQHQAEREDHLTAAVRLDAPASIRMTTVVQYEFRLCRRKFKYKVLENA